MAGSSLGHLAVAGLVVGWCRSAGLSPGCLVVCGVPVPVEVVGGGVVGLALLWEISKNTATYTNKTRKHTKNTRKYRC